MKRVFADTNFFVAIVNQRDELHEKAKRIDQSLSATRYITTDEVLVEFVTFFSARGSGMRKRAVSVAREILGNPNIQVLPQTRNSFLSGLELYDQRPDKGYSLTDCISMQTMEGQDLREVLTNDHHFEQEGFTILLPREETDGGERK